MKFSTNGFSLYEKHHHATPKKRIPIIFCQHFTTTASTTKMLSLFWPLPPDPPRSLRMSSGIATSGLLPS